GGAGGHPAPGDRAQPRAAGRPAARAADAVVPAHLVLGRGHREAGTAGQHRRRGGRGVVRAEHAELGTRWLRADGPVPVLVTGNETNNERIFGSANEMPYVKDGIDRAVVHGDGSAVNPDGTGTKAAPHYVLNVPAGGSAALRLRLNDADPRQSGDPF